MTKISVVIPTRDRSNLLAQALSTVLRQAQVTMEVIVVDDASSDDTADALHRIADDRLSVLRNERRSGPAHARNRGITAATGEWIAFLDDDDLWSPEKLRLQLEAGRAAGADFVYGSGVLVFENRRLVTADVTPPDPREVPGVLIPRNAMPAGSSNILVRADLLERTGGFDERLSQLADWDMWLRLAETGGAATCPDVVVACRRHATNMLLADASDVRHEFEFLARKHEALSRRLGIPFNPVAFSHWVAAGQREAGRRRAAIRTHLEAAFAYRDLRHLGSAVRTPFGDWAIGLRQPAAPEIPPPGWLQSHLRW